MEVTDWYLPSYEDAGNGWVYPGRKKIGENSEWLIKAQELLDLCQIKNKNEMLINYQGEYFRVLKINGVRGEIFHLRQIPSEVPDLKKIYPENYFKLLTHPKITSPGLILIAGETGQGKSTTCAGLIKARLERGATFCLTLENPPEFPLDGSYANKGLCIQTEVEEGCFGKSIRAAMRAYPVLPNSILFIGEVRDEETALEAIRAANNGHLVVTTIHGNGIAGALHRLSVLVSKELQKDQAQILIANSLRAVVHQKIKDGKMSVEALVSMGASSAVANQIRSGKFEHLNTEIQMQQVLIEKENWANLLKD